LAYGVFIHYHWSREGNTIDEDRELDFSDVETLKYNIESPQNDWCEISWKPYLRPMSSMTEEELKELNEKYENIAYFFIQKPPYYHGLQAQHSDIGSIEISEFSEIYDWLNARHFDYRGLIEKGLALEAPAEMYKTE
jgi:hypothetical protein